jgi:hypothetical protein
MKPNNIVVLGDIILFTSLTQGGLTILLQSTYLKKKLLDNHLYSSPQSPIISNKSFDFLYTSSI